MEKSNQEQKQPAGSITKDYFVIIGCILALGIFIRLAAFIILHRDANVDDDFSFIFGSAVVITITLLNKIAAIEKEVEKLKSK